MKRFNQYFLFSIFSILIMTSCHKDDDTGGGSNNNNEPPAGAFTATIGSDEFSADVNYARYRTTGELAIVAKDGNGTELKFVISDFIGNSIYPTNTASENYAEYQYIVNGTPVFFSTQDASAGSIEITGYSSGDQVLNGTFNLILSQQSGSALIEIQGEFSKVPIVELEEPLAGEAAMYIRDEFYKPTEISAKITNLRYFQIIMNGEDMPGPLSMHRPLNSDPDGGYLDYGGFFSWQRAYDESLPIFTYNEAQQNLTGKIFSYDFDAEIWFKEIQITSFPFEVETGEFALLTSSDTVYFDEATYTREDGPTTYITIEATNQAGNKVVFKKEYDNTNPDYNLYPADIGVSTVLKFYVDQNNSFPSYTTAGSFTSEAGSADNKLSVYFMSQSATDSNFSQVVSNDIDFIH